MSTAAASVPPPPQLVGLFRDQYDDNGDTVGWTVIGWGLVFPDLSAVTVPLDGKASASLWLTLEDALTALDAQVCEVKPRPYPRWWRDR